MEFLILISIDFIFCIIQFCILRKLKRVWIKWIPIGTTVISLLFCFILYLNVFGTNSQSVIAENQYFALFLAIPFSAAFIGCLLGIIICKLFSIFYE